MPAQAKNIEDRASRIVEYFRLHYQGTSRVPTAEEMEAWLEVEEKLIAEVRRLRRVLERCFPPDAA